MLESFERSAVFVEHRLKLCVFLLVLLLAGATVETAAAQDATVESEGITLSSSGDSGESAITVDADEGVSAADVTVSIDTGVAEITDARKGAGPFGGGASVELVDQTTDSVTFEYTDISGSESSFELGVVEFTARTEGEVVNIELSTANFNNANFERFDDVNKREGELTVTDGRLSSNNPFGDSQGNPVGRSTVIDRVVEWNLNGEISGTTYTRSEIINFVVEWNLET